MKRGFEFLEDAAQRMGASTSDVLNLVKSGRLQPDDERSPQAVTRASVDKYLASLQVRSGHFYQGIVDQYSWGVSDRLNQTFAAAAGTSSSEAVGADGGFAVPTVLSEPIIRTCTSGFDGLSRCWHVKTPSNNIQMPTDHKPAYDESGGITAHLIGENEPIPQSKVSLEFFGGTILQRIAALVPVSEELLDDAPALGGYINRNAPEKIAFKAFFHAMWGSGAPFLGWMQSPALKVIAVESGQTSDTINGQNVAKMYASMPVDSLPTAAWLIHPDGLGQFVGMTINSQIVYTTGDAEAPAGRLLGCPIIPHEACAQVGDLGDIHFVDLQQYMVVTKDPALKALQSLHVFFDRDLMAFRFVMRIAGAPVWSSPVASRVGGTIRSPFIGLAAR